MIDPEILLIVPMVFILVAVVGLYAWSIIWAYRDAVRRGKPGILVALLVAFLSWPMGFVAWLVFRPNEQIENHSPLPRQ